MPLFLRRRSYDAKEENFLLLLSYCGNQKTGFLGHFTPILSEREPSRLDNAVFVNLRCIADSIT